jgi:hypothetical protein
MPTREKIVERWRYLRGLMIEQLEALEAGALQMHTNDINISATAVAKLKRAIAEFDALISDADGGDI